MTRIVAKAKMAYDEYEIEARVYVNPNHTSWCRIVAIVKIDGKKHAIARNACSGLYWARRSMMDLVTELHGRY